ncbi:hypothetical protein N8987_00040 [Crocinitomix sp.]|nr:hypothetical protein [Crocinitomix sp.]
MIEPYYNWRGFYIASDDIQSPFYERIYSEFEFTDSIYNYYIHPQWDNIESATLFIKVLYADYDANVAIIELFGEWNDVIENDIMLFKRNIIEFLMENGICKFILIAENLFNFHGNEEDYYEEWFDEVDELNGWIALVNARDHVQDELKAHDLDYYFLMGGELEDVDWRTATPTQFISRIEKYVMNRLN